MNSKRKYRISQREIGEATLVKAWLIERRWATQAELELGAEQKWEFILALVAAAPDNKTLGSIGAGPLEDLLYGGSEDFIERVEREAAVNEKFRYSLSISRNPNLILKNPSREEEIQQRIVNAVRNDLPHTQ
jgi:hypothetical protein